MQTAPHAADARRGPHRCERNHPPPLHPTMDGGEFWKYHYRRGTAAGRHGLRTRHGVGRPARVIVQQCVR
eukprot:gene26796-6122_t